MVAIAVLDLGLGNGSIEVDGPIRDGDGCGEWIGQAKVELGVSTEDVATGIVEHDDEELICCAIVGDDDCPRVHAVGIDP